MFPFLEIFGHQFPMYGICAVCGAIVGFTLLYFTSKKRCLAKDDALYSCLYGLIGGLIGAKMLYLVTVLPVLIQNFAYFSAHLKTILALVVGGFVFYGGLIGGIFGMWLYCRQFKLKFLSYLDHAAIFMPLVHAFGRIGCFCAGCCYGIPYDGIFAVTFPTGTFGLAGVSLFPVQLLESALNLLLFVVMLLVFYHPRKPGRAAGTYLAAYAVLRFSLEFLRYDAVRGGFWGLSTSQWISIPLFLAGLYLLFFIGRRKTLSSAKNVV